MTHFAGDMQGFAEGVAATMDLTREQVLALAPDDRAVFSATRSADPRKWQSLGRSDEALWGLCQGSALYQVQVELTTLTAQCSCPSRKLPCKHSLGLLLLATTNPSALQAAETPDWVAEWLKKRVAAAERKHAKADRKNSAAADAAQARRATNRMAKVTAGVHTLDTWLEDLVRTGLATLEAQPGSFWERQAARLVDAQAPGLAARVRRLAGIPASGREWPDRLLSELGQIALLTHAFRRLNELDPAVQEDVRQQIGWTLTQHEVAARGEQVSDRWIVAGRWWQQEGAGGRGRTLRTWLLGTSTGRHALIVQSSLGGAPHAPADALVPGTCQEAELAFWPGAFSQRALVITRQGSPSNFSGPLPGVDTVQAALAAMAHALALQPWLDHWLFALNAVTLTYDGTGAWWARDRTGSGLPMRDTWWRLLAHTGGSPCDLVGEWDGALLRPLGILCDATFVDAWAY